MAQTLVFLYRFGVGEMFKGELFSVEEAEKRAKKFVKNNKGEIIQLRNVLTDTIVKIIS